MFSRFFNALRGGAAEAGDAIMDTDVMQNAEIRGATEKMQSDLDAARKNESVIGGNLNTSKRELKQLQDKFEVTMNAARKALAAGDEDKAQTFASDAELLQTEIGLKEQAVEQFQNALNIQKKNIAKIKNNLELVKRETKVLQSEKAVAKARQSAQSSLSTVSGEDSDNALAVIRKQKEKVSQENDRLDYADEQLEAASAQTSAEDYLKQSSGSSLLDQLKAEQNSK